MGSPGINNRLEELRQLCQEIAETEQRHIFWKHENAEEAQLKQTVQKELRELQISVALVQLDLVAPREITDKASALTIVGNTRELRRLILDLVYELEEHLSGVDRLKPDVDNLERSVKTISVLMELLESLEG